MPTIQDLTREENPRMLLRYGAIAPNQFGKVYMLRDGVPADRVATLEGAFARTFADPSFLADTEKSKLEITPIYGESIRQIVDDFLAMPTAVKEKLKRAIRR